MNNVYLAHHGIKGQKWGVRRYQNKNGSYTNEGKRRYGSGSKIALSPNKRYANFTDEEISNRVKRRQNEIKLEELEMQSSIPIGIRYVGGILKSGAAKGLTVVVGGVTFALAKKYLKDKYDLDIVNLKK